MLIICFQFIPMPVLYGVFLYMGASSLRGIQVKRFFFFFFFLLFIVVFVGVEWLIVLLLYSFSTA